MKSLFECIFCTESRTESIQGWRIICDLNQVDQVDQQSVWTKYIMLHCWTQLWIPRCVYQYNVYCTISECIP